MASPQTEHGNTCIANELFEALLAADLTGTQLRIMLAVARETYGEQRKTNRISYTRVAQLTNIAYRNIVRAMGDLAAAGYLVKLAGARNGWGIQKDYDLWGSDPQASGVAASDPQISDPQISDPQTTGAQATDPQTTDPGITPPSRSDRTPKPQTARAARSEQPASRTRDLTSSSGVKLKPDLTQEEEDEPRAKSAVAEVVHALVHTLGLTRRQARQAIDANRNLSLDDVAAWQAWLELVNEAEPMPIMVARLQNGEPVPRIRPAPAPPPDPAPSAPAFPPRLKYADLVKAQEERHAADQYG